MTKIILNLESPLKTKTSALVLGLFEGEELSPIYREIDRAGNSLLSRLIKDKEFEGKKKQTALIYAQEGLPFGKIALIGLGKREDFSGEILRQSFGVISTFLRDKGNKEFSIYLTEELKPVQTLIEGCLLALYQFDLYKTENIPDKKEIREIRLIEENRNKAKELQKEIDTATRICAGVYFSRDLINQPPNTVTPTYLAQAAKDLAQKHSFKTKIIDQREMEKLGMGSLLSVSRGSAEPPKLIVMEYFHGAKGKKPLCLVGKGLTFDSGGLSLKPSKSMETMKEDMSGGAAVLGIFMAIAALKLKINLLGIIPATENMPGGKATKPGDIVKSMSGKTIEILNTDAEGRLILADALTYAQKHYQPERIIDIATLTGACVIALGNMATGMMGNDEELKNSLKKSGEACGERLWELPLWEEYGETLKSNIADIKNIGDGTAGTIIGAMFLKKFILEKNWVHLDIAGTAWQEKGHAYIPKGGAGIGVRLLVDYIRSII